MTHGIADQLDPAEAAVPNGAIAGGSYDTSDEPKRYRSSIGSNGRLTAIFAKSRLTRSLDASAGRIPDPADLCGLYLRWIGARQPSKDRIYMDTGPASTAHGNDDAYRKLLEDMEFGRIGLLVVPNLDHLLLGTRDPYAFYSWCRQLDIELHAVDRGPTTVLDFAMHRFVGRGELDDHSRLTPLRPSSEAGDADRYGLRPETDIIQLGRLLHGRIRGPSGTTLSHSIEQGNYTLRLHCPHGVDYYVDGRELERQLACAMVVALIEEPPASSIPTRLGQPSPGAPALRRHRLGAILQVNSAPGTERGAGFGRLTRDDCCTIRQAIESLELEFDELGIPRFRLSFASGLALPSRILAELTVERAGVLRSSMAGGAGSKMPGSPIARKLPPLRRHSWTGPLRRR